MLGLMHTLCSSHFHAAAVCFIADRSMCSVKSLSFTLGGGDNHHQPSRDCSAFMTNQGVGPLRHSQVASN